MDEKQKQALSEVVDRNFTRGFGPWGHRVTLGVFGMGGGSAGFYFGFYPLLKQQHPAAFPFWFLAVEWAICTGAMLLMAEMIWRINRYIAKSEKDSWLYLIKIGINPWTLSRFKSKDPAKKG
ncbi:MAG TPA: hypothetical protein VLV87_10275 [Gammaproteobacteria bacterium]|nr:hypothetical protein [Gammaproteobacteria bacterium]